MHLTRKRSNYPDFIRVPFSVSDLRPDCQNMAK